MAEQKRSAEDDLAEAAALLVTSMSRNNLRKGDSPSVYIPRHRVTDLRDTLDRLYPGWVDRIFDRMERLRASEHVDN